MKLIPRTLHDAVRVAVACSTLAAFTATAAVSEQEAAKLGKELTPVGAERAANKEGTIPAWTGGMTTPQAGWYCVPPLPSVTSSTSGELSEVPWSAAPTEPPGGAPGGPSRRPRAEPGLRDRPRW